MSAPKHDTLISILSIFQSRVSRICVLHPHSKEKSRSPKETSHLPSRQAKEETITASCSLRMHNVRVQHRAIGKLRPASRKRDHLLIQHQTFRAVEEDETEIFRAWSEDLEAVGNSSLRLLVPPTKAADASARGNAGHYESVMKNIEQTDQQQIGSSRIPSSRLQFV